VTFGSDELFSLQQLPKIRLTLSAEAIADLGQEPREYVSGGVSLLDREFTNVGIRLKGTFSFQGLGGKAAFKLKFNKFENGARLFGLEGLTLNNMRQDHTQLHEVLAYKVFRAAGAAAPRVGFAEVYVNDVYYGLYALIESQDDSFLEHRFADASGSLYEGDFGDDLVPEDLWEFDQDEGADKSREDLSKLIAAVGLPGDDVFFGDDALVDVDPFLAFVASEGITGHWDGYRKSHNYRIYHEPSVDKWYFFAWGADQAMQGPQSVFGSMGLLSRKCFALPTCLAEYKRVALDVADVFEALDLEKLMDDAITLTQDALARDTRQPWPLEGIDRHRLVMRDLIRAQPDEWRQRLQCLDDAGNQRDLDGDGYGACFDDCDDSSDQASPVGTEVCDGLDNDCNGLVDDLAECTCPTQTLAGVTWHFCDREFSWSRAAQHCRDLGAELATIEDAVQNTAVWQATQSIRTGWWWHGLNDGAVESVYTWSDGSDASFRTFAIGEDDDHGTEDCVGFTPHGNGDWGDVRCQNLYPFVCRSDD